jgi:predicted nucleic acid-binding protein
VLTEVADALAKPKLRGGFTRLLNLLESDPDVDIVAPEVADWRRGVELYNHRPDKSWSLTDCISFAVMRQRGITDALTGDRHFEQAGFNALLA